MYNSELNKKSAHTQTIIAAIAAFCVYTCMYAYRKPFTVGLYGDMQFLNVDYKIWLVIAQTVGYTMSKFFGIRFIAEISARKRLITILQFIGVAWLALLFFAIVPPPYNIIFLFINGFPLGVIYGIVFSYLEGRKTTEFLGAVLASSFIFASGFTQSVGKFVISNLHVSEWWMPFVTGLIFMAPLLIFSFLLDKTPPPNSEDILLRTKRSPMNKKQRKAFVNQFFSGLALLIITYVMLTMLRDYRSNFAANIWEELGLGGNSLIFTTSELIPSIAVLVIMSLLILIRNNMKAFLINHWLIIGGFLLATFSTILFMNGVMNGFWWMTITGTGLYIGYVPFNCMLFERLIASFKYVSTAGFIIYVADSFGYLGSTLILFAKNFSNLSITWTDFFTTIILVISAAGVILTLFSMMYFKKKYQDKDSNQYAQRVLTPKRSNIIGYAGSCFNALKSKTTRWISGALFLRVLNGQLKS